MGQALPVVLEPIVLFRLARTRRLETVTFELLACARIAGTAAIAAVLDVLSKTALSTEPWLPGSYFHSIGLDRNKKHRLALSSQENSRTAIGAARLGDSGWLEPDHIQVTRSEARRLTGYGCLDLVNRAVRGGGWTSNSRVVRVHAAGSARPRQ